MLRLVAWAPLLSFLIAFTPVDAGESSPASNWIDAKETFGLVGDGVADDTAGIQAMFQTQRPVFLANGIYRITKTISGRSSTQIHGGSGGFTAKRQSTILYDGPEGGIALRIENCSFFTMRHITVDGAGKAGIGVYWCYTTNESSMENCSIIRTKRHGLFVTKTWYAHFNRLCVRNNQDRGITLDREGDTEPNLGKGAIKHVTFFECRSSNNGARTDYDGNTIVDTGYGFGSFGCNMAINVIACVFGANGGPGVYLAGHPVNITISGCYFEQNGLAVERRYKRYRTTYGKGWEHNKDHAPLLGRMAHIIEDTEWPWSVVFDNCYCLGGSGIWLRGQGNNNPIEFRNLARPTVVWSEHGNWVMINSSTTPVAGRPGIIRRGKDGTRHLFDPVPGPSGHPGYVMLNGVCRLWPHSPDGLALFVDTDAGNDRSDGRTPETAWKSLGKATRMLSNTTLDTPVTINVAGTTATSLDLHNVSGIGIITIECDSALSMDEARAANVLCRLVLKGNDKLAMQKLRLARCLDVEITDVAFKADDDEGALVCEGSSGVTVKRCAATSTGKDTVVIAALRNSTVSVVKPEQPHWRMRTEDGGQIRLTQPNTD